MKVSRSNLEQDLLPIISIIGLVLFGVIFYRHYELLKIAKVEDSYLVDIKNIDEYKSRITWGLSSIFLFFVHGLNIVLALYIIYKNLSKPNPLLAYILPAGILIMTVALAVGLKDFDISGAAGNMLLENVKTHLSIDVSNTIDLSMQVSAITVLLIVIAMSSLLIRTKGSFDVAELKNRFSYYKASIYCTTFFLAAGTFQVYCLYRWAIHSNNTLDEEAKRLLADTLSFSGGIIYTIVFLCMFIPVSLALNNWSKKLAVNELKNLPPDEDENKSIQERINSWLQNHGLYRSPKRIASNFLILAAPSIIPIAIEIIKKTIIE